MDKHKNAMFMKIQLNLNLSEFILFSIIPNGGIDVSVYIASGVLCYFGQT